MWDAGVAVLKSLTAVLLMNVVTVLPCVLHDLRNDAYSPPVALMAIRFGDLRNSGQKRCASLASTFAPAELFLMAAVRGRPSGLPVSVNFRFANLRAAATLLFGDN